MRFSRAFSVVFLGASVAAAVGCGKGPGEPPPPEPPTVATVRPKLTRLNPTKEFTGRLVTKDPVKVLPQVTGRVLTREFKDGDFVEEGKSVLFRIDPILYKADVEKAKADISKAQADIANWTAQIERDKAEYARIKQQIDTGVGSKTESDKAAASVKVSEAQLEVSKATKIANESALTKAEESLKYCTIYAPTTGRASQPFAMPVAPGALVDAYKTELVSVYPVTPVYCLWEVDELTSLWYTDRIRTGAIATPEKIGVTIKLKNEKDYATDPNDRVHNSTVNYADVRIERETGTRTIRAEFENPLPPAQPGKDRVPPLLDGSSVKVRVAAGNPREVLAIPESVVFSQNRKQYVYAVTEGKAQLREIEPGEAFNGLVEVNRRASASAPSGLDESDTVVADNLLRVRPGATVTVK